MTLTLVEALLLFGFLGALAGGFAFLFRMLVASKDDRIKELVAERDYYRSAALIERELPGERHPAALPSGAVVIQGNGNARSAVDPAANEEAAKRESRFAAYSLAIQAGISIIIICGSFYIIVQPTDVTANQVAYQLLSFVVGVWLGRGIDYATGRGK